MSETWPPAPTPDRPWRERRLPQRGVPSAAVFLVREVQLWGRSVLIDQHDDVFCDGCREFVRVAVLGRPDNKHRVGLPRRVVSGQTVPMESDAGPGSTASWPRWNEEQF